VADAIPVRRSRAQAFEDVRFIPARWLLLLLALARTLTGRATIGKLGIAGLVWTYTPRKLKLAAAILAASGLIVIVGALAAITILVLQLT